MVLMIQWFVEGWYGEEWSYVTCLMDLQHRQGYESLSATFTGLSLLNSTVTHYGDKLRAMVEVCSYVFVKHHNSHCGARSSYGEESVLKCTWWLPPCEASYGFDDSTMIGTWQGYESFTNSEVRVNSQHPASQKQAAPAARTGSSRFYTPASDPDFAFRFAQPASTLSKETRFGANSFVIDSAADETVYSQFNFDNSDATSDPTATYGSTSPAVSSSYDTQLRSRNNNNNAGGHGCANM